MTPDPSEVHWSDENEDGIISLNSVWSNLSGCH